jgi:hypothetical protein
MPALTKAALECLDLHPRQIQTEPTAAARTPSTDPARRYGSAREPPSRSTSCLRARTLTLFITCLGSTANASWPAVLGARLGGHLGLHPRLGQHPHPLAQPVDVIGVSALSSSSDRFIVDSATVVLLDPVLGRFEPRMTRWALHARYPPHSLGAGRLPRACTTPQDAKPPHLRQPGVGHDGVGPDKVDPARGPTLSECPEAGRNRRAGVGHHGQASPVAAVAETHRRRCAPWPDPPRRRAPSGGGPTGCWRWGTTGAAGADVVGWLVPHEGVARDAKTLCASLRQLPKTYRRS